MALTEKDLSLLKSKGITKSVDTYGTQFIFSTLGIFYLLNVLYESSNSLKKQRISADFLKSLSKVSPTEAWRSLRIKRFELPVYDGEGYQLAYYLNGSPPRMLHNSSYLLGISQRIGFSSPYISNVFESESYIEFREDEISTLDSGAMLEIRKP